MGATDFMTKASGGTAQLAFNSAKERARESRGNEGYTGTIAEKTSFKMVELPDDLKKKTQSGELGLTRAAQMHAQVLLDDDNSVVSNKWGPAGCIALDPGHWLFFGWASE